MDESEEDEKQPQKSISMDESDDEDLEDHSFKNKVQALQQ